MLKYEVNYRELQTDTVEVPIINYEIEDNVDDPDQLTVTCYYDDDIDLRPETPLFITSEFDTEVSTQTDSESNSIVVSSDIIEVNTNFRYFSFNINKWYDLKITEVQIEVSGNEPYLKFIFENYHYFNSWDEPITFYADFVGDDGVIYEKTFENCQWEDEYTLVWKYVNDSPDIDLFMCNVFHSDTYTFVGYEGNADSVEVEEVPATACFIDEVYIKKKVTVGCEEKYEYYEKNCNDGDINGLTVYRDQFIDDFKVYATIGKFKIIVPISQTHDVTLFQEDNVINRFVYDETRRAINSVVEMEKFVYHPVYVKEGDTFNTEDIYKIKFNLHFRQHRGDDWSVDDSSYWNGVDNDSVQLEEMMLNSTGVPFFTYHDDVFAKSKQSDLLTYLGFTNADVKYQKSKLKKSFLRVMVYDSDNPVNQNMLAYSTIFMDGGALFSKYMNNVMTEGYAISEGDNNNTFVGAKVNMEYAPDGYQGPEDQGGKTNEELEEHRLSSQITVMDTYSSKASSEGMNIYMWADNDTGNLPKDIYMKFEFNHAGYGRTIPFMIPFKDPMKGEGYGIKTFEEIVADWRSGNGYGIRKYLKYSYLHLKCRYDKEKEKRVYYLDPDTYGPFAMYGQQGNNDDTPNELEINLYEAKVTFLNENDESV